MQNQSLYTLSPEYSSKVVTQPKIEKQEIVKSSCNKVHCSHYSSWGWFGALVLWFIVFIVLFWLIFYSLKPSFVLQSGSNQVDTAKVLLAAVISALILIIIVWLIKIAVGRKH